MTTPEHYSRSSKNRTYLELGEVARLQESPTNLRDRLLIRLLFHVGCRVSEALAITTDDVDFGAGLVTIEHLKTRIKLSCPRCGTRLGRGHTHCPKCGVRVDRLVAEEKEHRRVRTCQK